MERNLHDGAQQRLFALQLRLAAVKSRTTDARLAQELDELVDEVAAVLEECRDLAHGLYPTVLRDRGLTEALRAAARTATIPVCVDDRGVDRCSPVIEEAVYFCSLEAIQNAAKHAGDGALVAVTLERRGNDLAFSIRDEGRASTRPRAPTASA